MDICKNRAPPLKIPPPEALITLILKIITVVGQWITARAAWREGAICAPAPHASQEVYKADPRLSGPNR